MNLGTYAALIRLDFATAVLLTVVAPLALLLAARLRGDDSLWRRLIIYWRVAALLVAALYLLLAAHPLAFAAGVLARALIPLALFLPSVWPGITEPPVPATPLGRLFGAWRGLTATYCAVGLVATLPLLRCTFEWRLDEVCFAWTHPAELYASWVHPGISVRTAELIGLGSLGLYLALLLLFVVRKTPWLRRR